MIETPVLFVSLFWLLSGLSFLLVAGGIVRIVQVLNRFPSREKTAESGSLDGLTFASPAILNKE